MPQCDGTNRFGQRCGAHALRGTNPPRCPLHDKQTRAAAVEANRKAHTRRRARTSAVVVPLKETPGELETLEDVARWLRWTTVALATGKLDARTGSEITKSLKELRPTLAQLATEEEVRKLRAELAALKPRIAS